MTCRFSAGSFDCIVCFILSEYQNYEKMSMSYGILGMIFDVFDDFMYFKWIESYVLMDF